VHSVHIAVHIACIIYLATLQITLQIASIAQKLQLYTHPMLLQPNSM